MTTRRTAYRILSDKHCPSCRNNLDSNHLKLSADDGSTFSSVYKCPQCDTTSNYTITFQPPTALVCIRSADGDLITESRQIVAQLGEQGQIAERQYNYIHYLDTSLKIVLQNLKQLMAWGENFPEIFENLHESPFSKFVNLIEKDTVVGLGRNSIWIGLHTHIHNYLSSVYSHHCFVENTIDSILESDAETDRLQTQYNTDSKPLLGLRHYTQHQMVAPVHVRLNTDSANRVVDILVDPDDLRDFEFNNGFDEWFGAIEGDYIDLISQGTKHYQNAGNHAIERIKTAREEHAQNFQELEKMEKEHLNLDDIDTDGE